MLTQRTLGTTFQRVGTGTGAAAGDRNARPRRILSRPWPHSNRARISPSAIKNNLSPWGDAVVKFERAPMPSN